MTTPKVLVGMVHLGPLPGSPRYANNLPDVIERAVQDALCIEQGGMNAVMVENFFDSPFYKTAVPAHTCASMTLAVSEIRRSIKLPIGVNVLRNDALTAMAIAHACNAQFIRCNVFVGAMVTDQGLIEGISAELLRYRDMLGANVKIWADVHVKHAVPLAETTIEQEARDAVERGLADAIIVSGTGTGCETPLDKLKRVRTAVPNIPLYVGSGVNAANISNLLRYSDGIIVGTGIKHGGDVSSAVEIDKVRELAMAF